MSFINAAGPLSLGADSSHFRSLLVAEDEVRAGLEVVEERTIAVWTLHLTAEELAPFRVKVESMRDRKIALAKDILIDSKHFNKVQLWAKLKMAGLIVAVALIGLALVFAGGGIGFGGGCLLNALAPFLAAELLPLISFIIFLGIASLSGIVGYKGAEFMDWLWVKGEAAISNSVDIDGLEDALTLKIAAYAGNPDNVLVGALLEENIAENLPLLERLKDPEFLAAVTYDYVKTQLEIRAPSWSFQAGMEEDIFRDIKYEIEWNDQDGYSYMDRAVMSRLLRNIQENDRWKLTRAKASAYLSEQRDPKIPASLVTMMSSYMSG